MNQKSFVVLLGILILTVLVLAVPNILITDQTGRNASLQSLDAPSALAAGPALPPRERAPAYQAGTWVYTGGPSGGLGYDVRMDPNNPDVMYVTDGNAGAFKSLDGGLTWFPINNGITTRLGENIPVFSLTIDPNNSSTLWLGTQYSSDVYRSDNAGASWLLKSNGISETSLSVRGFTVEPGNSNTVYMAAEISSWEWNGDPLPGLGLDMTKGVVYKTTDRGDNWTKIWEGDNLARYIWINPQNLNEIFVSTGIFDREAANSDPNGPTPGGVGILRSSDAGQTWQELDESYGFDANELYIGSLFMHPSNPAVLLAASGDDPYSVPLGQQLGGVYRTVNGGNSWTEVLGPYNFSAVEFCTGDPNIAYAGALSGFYRSEDAGQTWIQTGGNYWGPPGIVAGFPIDIMCDPRDPLRLVVNNYGGGNFVSTDGGITWQLSSQGYTGALMREIEIFPQNPGMVFATARSGVFGSVTGGNSWYGLGYGPARQLDAAAAAMDPGDPQHLFASILDLGPNPIESFNGGQSWTVNNTGIFFPPPAHMLRVKFAPGNSQYIYASIGHSDCLIFGRCDTFPGYGVIVSRDGGLTWDQQAPLDSGTVLGFAISPQNPATAFAGVIGGGLYRTDNAGQSWQLINPGPWAPSTSGLNGGDADAPRLAVLAIDPQNPNKMLAGFWDGAVSISTDAGLSWTYSSAGMPAQADVQAFAIDPVDPSVIYAGSLDSGVFLSTNGGASWTALNTGLTNKAVRDLAISSDGSVLYMASDGAGVFRLGDPPPGIFLPIVIRE